MTIAKILGREHDLDDLADTTGWAIIDFHHDPGLCDHVGRICPACVDTWLEDHYVALPHVYQAFYRSMAAAHERHELRFTLPRETGGDR